jgi:hypothetical protein
MKENPFPERTGTISVVNQELTIKKLGRLMILGEPFKMAGCLSKLLGSPAYVTEITRFIALAEIAEQMQNKKYGLMILGALGYHFEESVKLALIDAEFPIDLTHVVLCQRMSHLMYKKAEGLIMHLDNNEAEFLAKDIRSRAKNCEYFAFQNLAAAIIKIAANLGEGICENTLRDLILAGNSCRCPVCDNIAVGTKRILDGWEKNEEN